MEIIKYKILSLILNKQVPSVELFTQFLGTYEDIKYPIQPLVELFSTIDISSLEAEELYNFLSEIYINYNKALNIEEYTPIEVILLYLTLFCKRYNFINEELDFLLQKYNNIKGYIPNNKYSSYIFYQIKISVLYIYNLDEQYTSYVLPLIGEINQLYENLDKPFIF